MRKTLSAEKRYWRSKRRQAAHPPSMLPWDVYKLFTYPEWYKTKDRNAIRKRDKHTCHYCKEVGTNKTLQVHHINYDKRDCRPNNLISLCPSCHAKTNYRRLYWFKDLWKFMRNELLTIA